MQRPGDVVKTRAGNPPHGSRNQLVDWLTGELVHRLSG